MLLVKSPPLLPVSRSPTLGKAALVDFPYPDGSTLNSRVNYICTTVPNGVRGYANIEVGIINNTMTNAKAFYSTLADTNDFSADISIQNNRDSEVLEVANASLFSGNAGDNFLSCDNFSGDPADQLIEGDIVTFTDDTGRSINKMVQFATKPVGYGSLRSKAVIYFTTTIPNAVTGKTVERIRLRTKGEQTDSLIFQLPQSVISSMETNQEETGISYQIFREFITNINAGAETITLNTGRPNETFISNEAQTSIVVSENISDPSDPDRLEGRVLTTSSVDVTQDDGRKIVITLSEPIPATSTIKLLLPVFVVNAKAKRKIFRNEQSC